MHDEPRVLWIDDDLLVRRISARLLASHLPRWRVELVASNREALSALEREAPALVVQDFWRPDGTGEDLLRALRVRAPHLPVVTVSGACNPGVLLRLGSVAALEKPFDRDELVPTLQAALAYGAAVRHQEVRPVEAAGVPVPAELTGCEAPIATAKLRLARYARDREPFLVRALGEHCAERIGRVIHALSPAHEGPLVVVTASADETTSAARLWGDPILGPGALRSARRGTLVVRAPGLLSSTLTARLYAELLQPNAPRLVAVQEAPHPEHRPLLLALAGRTVTLPSLAERSPLDQALARARVDAEGTDELLGLGGPYPRRGDLDAPTVQAYRQSLRWERWPTFEELLSAREHGVRLLGRLGEA